MPKPIFFVNFAVKILRHDSFVINLPFRVSKYFQ